MMIRTSGITWLMMRKGRRKARVVITWTAADSVVVCMGATRDIARRAYRRRI